MRGGSMHNDIYPNDTSKIDEGESSSSSSLGTITRGSSSHSFFNNKAAGSLGLFFKPIKRSPAELLEHLMQRALDPNASTQALLEAILIVLHKNKNLINHAFTKGNLKGQTIAEIAININNKPFMKELHKLGASIAPKYLPANSNVTHLASYRPR
jgi:hypothetical protein